MPAAQTAMEKKKRFFVPSGNFERVLDPNSGREIVNPDVFNFVEKEYIMPDTFFQTFYNGIVGGISIMANLLIVSGVLGVLESTGAFSAGIHKLVRATKGKELSLVVIMYVLFTVFGVLGYGEGAYPFYGLAVMVIMSAGYDRMTGAATVILGSCGSFACGMLNMFTTGVSQQIVGLPMFSGMWYRAVVLVVFFTIGLVFLLHYAIKTRKDPTKSYCYDEYKDQDASGALGEEVPMDGRRILALVGFLIVTIIQGYGCVSLGWSFPNITAMYIIFMIVLAVIFGISPNEVCNRFTAGAARVLGPALAIGFANGVMVLLNEANIMDTAVYYMSNALQGKSPLITLLIIYVFVTCLNFFVVSRQGGHDDAHPQPPGADSGHQPAGHGAHLSVGRRPDQLSVARRRRRGLRPVRHRLRQVVPLRHQSHRHHDGGGLYPDHRRQRNRLRPLLSGEKIFQEFENFS